MAAVSFSSGHSLEERIYQMQKLDLDTRTREVLEEASQLCSGGRQIEASALVEKAEAMLSAVSVNVSHTATASADREEGSKTDAASSEEPLAARIVANVANGLTKVLVDAIQDLERHMTGETRRLASAIDQRLDKLQATVESMQPVKERLDKLAEAGTAVQEKYEQLAATTAALQGADALHSEEIGALRLQVQELSAAMTRIDEVCRRIEGQEHEISAVNSTISELTSKMAAAAGRLERHAGAIRALYQGSQKRASALEQVVDALSRIKTVQNDADGALASI
jgi:chromosome segregation ATPase